MAIAAAFPPPTTLGRALGRFGFVQADPIRAPARAQDLILRHRVADYRAGDLETRFAALRLEEDFLYAYGIMPRATWRLLHPRHDPDGEAGRHVPAGLAADVLAFVRERRVIHPRDLAVPFGRERALNGWGSWSAATTRALQSLHYYGLLRVPRRRDGIRLYAPAPPHDAPPAPEQRTQALILLVARILAPLPERSLRPVCALLSRGAPDLTDPAAAVRALLAAGALEGGMADGERYLWPAGLRAPSVPDRVRILAPFDPLVWDRRRFTALWDWDYRFEAYVPAPQRRLGYYAMPLLFGTQVVGWVNATNAGGRLQAKPGFIAGAPRSAGFRRGLEAEIEALRGFLQPRD
jgi:hypothetical protein